MGFLVAEIASASTTPVTPTTVAASASTPILYDLVGGTANLRGYQVGNEVQPIGWSGGARLTIGSATGNATNTRSPQAVLLQERTYRLSAAVSEITAFSVPAQGATVTVAAATGGVNAVNGVIGGNPSDLADIQAVGQYLFAVSDDGLRVAGLYRVVSGSIGAGLVIERIDDGTLSLVQNSGQVVVSIGATTSGPMRLAVYSRLEPLPGQTFWSVQGISGRRVLSSAFENQASTDASLRSDSIQDLIQLSARNVVFSNRLGPLHSRFPIGEYLGDGDSADVLDPSILYLHGQGDSAGEKDAHAIVSWWAGYYPGSAAHG